MADAVQKEDPLKSALWASYVSPADRKKKEQEEANAIREPKNQLDKDAFLNLLMQQMKFQDPLNPTDDKQFLAQMAQFTSLEQMQNINKVSSQNQAFSLIGKSVDGQIYNGTTGKYTDVSGMVESVVMKGNETYLKIGEQELAIGSVANVYDDINSTKIDAVNTNLITSQNIGLIGKTIQAVTMDSKYNPTGFVEGKVDFVKFASNGTPILMVGDKEVYSHEVISVGEEIRLLGKNVNAEYLNKTTNLMEKVSGPIDDVVITAGSLFLLVGGKNIPVEPINYLTDALSYVGKDIKYKDVSGKVDSILVKNKKPYFVVGENQVAYTDLKGIKETTTTDTKKEEEKKETADK